MVSFFQRSRYSEAMALNQRLERLGGDRSKTRQAIMKRFSNIVPKFAVDDGVTLTSKWPGGAANLTQQLPVTAMAASAAKISPKPTFQSSQALKKIAESRPFPAADFTPFRPRNKRRLVEDLEEEEDQITTRSPSPKPTARESSILSVLTTPQIERRQTSFLRHSSLGSFDHRSATPQSILKVKMAAKFQPESPLSTLFASNRCSNVDDDESSEADDNWLTKRQQQRRTSTASRESTPGKSLRFSVPKKLPPAELVTPEQSSLGILPENSVADESATEEVSDLGPAKPTGMERSTVFGDDDSIVLVDSDMDDETGAESKEEEPEVVDEEETDGADVEMASEHSEAAEVDELERGEVDEEVDATFESATGDVENVDQPPQASEVDQSLMTTTTTFDDEAAPFLEPTQDKSTRKVSDASMLPNVTFYAPDATLAFDASLVSSLATQDSEGDVTQATMKSAPLDQTQPISICGSEDSNRQSNVTMYGSEDTVSVDDSFVKELVEGDASGSTTSVNETRTTTLMTPRRRGQTSTAVVDTETTFMYGSGGATPGPNISLVNLLAAEDFLKEDSTSELGAFKTTRPEVGDDQDLGQSEFSIPQFSFSEPSFVSSRVLADAEPESEKPKTEFKFQKPYVVVSQFPKLVFDETLDQTSDSSIWNETVQTPAKAASVPDGSEAAAPATPKTPLSASAKKRRPRFSESFAASASQLAAIFEEGEAVTMTTPTKMLNEQSFRVKSRKRSTSDSCASPSVEKSQRRSTRSSSDVSVDTRVTLSALSKPEVLDNTLPAVIEEAKEADVSDEMTVSLQHEAEAQIISENEPAVAAEVVDLKPGSEAQTEEVVQPAEHELYPPDEAQAPESGQEPPVSVAESEDAEPSQEPTEAKSPDVTLEVEKTEEVKPETPPSRVTRRSSSSASSPKPVPDVMTYSRRTRSSASGSEPKLVSSETASPRQSFVLEAIEKADSKFTDSDETSVDVGKVDQESEKASAEKSATPALRTTRRTTASPFLIQGVTPVRKTRSSVSEKEPEDVVTIETKVLPEQDKVETEEAAKMEESNVGSAKAVLPEQASAGKPEKPPTPMRMTRRMSSSAASPSPIVAESAARRRRTRSSVSESEPEHQVKVSTPSRRSSRKVSQKEEVEETAAAEASVNESSKRKRSDAGASPSSPPPRKSSRLEESGHPELKTTPKPVSDFSPQVVVSEPATPEVSKSESRRRTRKSSTSASPAPAETSVRTRSRTKSGTEAAEPSTPVRTPSRRHTTAMSVTKLSPILETVSHSNAAAAAVDDDAEVASPRTLRHKKTPALAEAVLPVKRTRSTPAKTPTVSKPGRPRRASATSETAASTTTTETTAKRMATRKTLVLADPFSPVNVKLDEDVEEEAKPKKKYVTRKIIKSHKI